MTTERAAALEEAAVLLEEFADYDDRMGERREAETNRLSARCIRGMKVPGAMEKCMCGGCETQVEMCSRSGLCWPCASEDCGHE